MSEPHATPQNDRAAYKLAALQRQAELLERLSLAAERLALTIEAEAAEARAAGAPVREDAAMCFSRVARAARMSVMLHGRLLCDMDEAQGLEEVRALQAEEARAEREAVDEIKQDPAYQHKGRVEGIVHRVVKAHCDDDDEIDRLMHEASERLDDDDIFGDVRQRPVGELVALICRDLDLDPDWTRLAEEAWAKEEIASGVPSSPFLQQSPSHPPPTAAGEAGPAFAFDGPS